MDSKIWAGRPEQVHYVAHYSFCRKARMCGSTACLEWAEIPQVVAERVACNRRALRRVGLVAATERLHADVVGFLAVALLHTVWRLTKDQSGECGAAASQLQPAAMGALRWAGWRRAERPTDAMYAGAILNAAVAALQSQRCLGGCIERDACWLQVGSRGSGGLPTRSRCAVGFMPRGSGRCRQASAAQLECCKGILHANQ